MAEILRELWQVLKTLSEGLHGQRHFYNTSNLLLSLSSSHECTLEFSRGYMTCNDFVADIECVLVCS